MENSLHRNQTGDQNQNRNQDQDRDQHQSTTEVPDNAGEKIPLRTSGGGQFSIFKYLEKQQRERQREKKIIEKRD
jgi:hypothetical protein